MTNVTPLPKSTCDVTDSANGCARPELLLPDGGNGPDSAAAPPSNVPAQNATRKPGPPIGSMNAVRHGMTLPAGKFPPKAKSAEKRLYRFKGWLVSELEKLGPVEGPALALIQTCCRHEKQAILADRWLRLDDETLPIMDRLRLLDAVTTATAARDKVLVELGLKLQGTRPGDSLLPSYAAGRGGDR